MDRKETFSRGLASYHHDIAMTRPFPYTSPHSQADINALNEATSMILSRQETPTSIKEEADRQCKTSQNSDDSFSAYIDHPIQQSTPPHLNHHVHASKGSLEQDLIGNRSRESTQGADSVNSGSSNGAQDDYGEASWPTTVDNEEDQQQCNEKSSIPHGSIVIPDMELNDEDDGEMETGGEKKRRRRTNKAEANVLASVFAQTQFPDAVTREDLAQKLNMKPKAVSIWFQNRRQAMKKRASRFGGVEGVNGPTVNAASIQVLGVGPPSRSPHREARDLSTERLKRWMSLDDVALVERKDKRPVEAFMKVDVASPPCTDFVESKLSSAPILDFICKQRGQHQLSRMASMPSLVSLITAKQDISKAPCPQKDLRDLLPSKMTSDGIPSLHRRSSASSLLVHRSEEKPVTKQALRERCFSLQMNNEGRAAVASPMFISSNTESTPVTFPSIISKMLQKHGRKELSQMESIWQRMQSSSSASDSHFGSSDKENCDPAQRMPRGDGEEDEERTLRLIAGKRAAKEIAKREKMLSEEGRRYVEEADARVALQQRKRPSLSSHLMTTKPTSATSRKWNRAVSDAQVMQRNKVSLTRVPSLDMTAGRDRSKDNGKTSFRSVSEMRFSKRPLPSTLYNDENHPNTTLQARLSLQQKKRSRHSHSNYIDLHSQTISNQSGTPFGSRRPDHTLLRRFASSNSLPTPALSLLSCRLGIVGSFPSIPGSARESSARLDGAQPISSSQESSENGSDDWLEAWAQEKTSGSKDAASRMANALRDHTNILNMGIASSKLPVARHDDSGFFGSESGDEFDGEMPGKRSSKRKLVSRGSSSPSKRGGDDRDRLAAETLLGLGSL